MAGAANQISRKKHVQELSMEGVEVPDQYISKDPTALIRGPEDVKESLPFMDLPVIDFTRLITSHEEEVGKLREAFSSWGCFHIINHGIESIMDEIRKDAKEFFQLPMEEKLKYGKEPNDLEGYGNDNVALETQARDWIDRIFLTVTPQDQRRMHLWPKNPHSFRKTLQDYTEKATNIIEILIKFAAKSLDLPENIFLSKCGEKPLSHCRINFYPPCPKPELVFGLKPHTDGSVITLVLPDEEVEGFQFHKDGQWYRVRPLQGAFEVNLGDQFQVLSNGIFKSVFHRVVANKEKERMSIALFWNPEKGKGIGPLEELINENRPRLYNKVNLSIAIIPMSHQFGWNSSVAGLVQSSFFWGYALSQLPGGWLAKIYGGRKVLKIGVLAWSIATALVPSLAGFMPGLLASRILVGIGEGVSPSAATDMIARSIPLEERSRAVSFVFGGLSFGSVIGLLLAPPLIQNYGWESVFYIFGLLGVAWFSAFQFVEEDQPSFDSASAPTSDDPGLQFISKNNSLKASLAELGGSLKDVPWKAFFQSKAVWAMIYAHFCGSWGHYTCLSWLPTYFSEELDLNLTEAAWVSVLPPLASIFVTSIAAQLADNLIAKGVDTTVVRKICQTIAFLSPATCMVLASLDLSLPPWEVVTILTGGLALSSFALSGLYCTHQDMSSEYASILLGITNTVGAVPGIVGVALTGYLLDSTHSWSISLFMPSIFFYLTGTVVWLALASSKPQTFLKRD